MQEQTPIPPHAGNGANGGVPPTDHELLARLRVDRDERAYKILYDRYFPDLYRQAMFKLNGDTEAAEDVLQLVFVDFWVQEKWLVVKDNLKGYLAKMMHFKAAGYIRENVRHRENARQYSDQVIFGGAAEIDAGASELEAKESAGQAAALLAALQAEIASLPEQVRKVFTEVYLNEKKYAAVAEEHDISINTVKDYMKVAMRKLRAKLSGLGVLLLTIAASLGLLSVCAVLVLSFFNLFPTLSHHLNDC